MKNLRQFARGDGDETLARARLDSINELFADPVLFADVPEDERDQLIEDAWFQQGPSILETELIADKAPEGVPEDVVDLVDDRSDALIDYLLREEEERPRKKPVPADNGAVLFYRQNARACLVAAGFVAGLVGAGGAAMAISEEEGQEPSAAVVERVAQSTEAQGPVVEELPR